MDASHTGSSSAASEAPTTGEHRMGTTTVGVCYNGGVILGDSRTSTGMYVANRASDKITQLKDNVYVCRPGSDTDLMKLRTNGLPPYLPQMDDMFQGNTVINDVSSDEEAGEEEDDLTPMSIGNKRASSSSTTASSPSKRSKSLAVRSINSLMTTYNEIARERLQLQKEMHRENKQMQENIRMELSWKIAECTRIAEQEMGLSADTPTLLDGLFYLSKSESYMDLFLSSTSEAVRMRIIEKLAHNNAPVQNYGYASTRKELLTQLKNEEDELLSELMADEEEDEFILGMYQYALYIDKYLTRAEYRVSKVTGLEWVHAKLSNEKASYNMFRMTPTMFISLHDLLVEKYGLKSTTKSSSIEALGMFLWMVGAPESVRQAEDRFERSLGTVSKMFNKVLNCLVKLAADIIKPVDPEFKTLNPRLRNPKFYPYFKNCIGAIDGTHVQCVVPNDMFVQHMCRKGITTQNVMACCDFDMRFTFVIAGWPGSVHDMRVFNDSTTTYNVVFPHPPQGKYYLVDSGYANRQGYLAPYKGTKYHLQEFQDAHKPEGMYVANRASDKITQLTDNVYVCRSGSAADTQVISDYVRYFLHQHTIQLGQPATVKVAANLIRLLAYQNKNMLQAGMIIGGWDKYEGGQIFSVPLGGTILKQPFAIGGSGSSYLYALLDHEWKEGMSQEEAEKFVVKVVSLAMARDGASGGVVRTVTINADGVKRNFYPGDKLPLWHDELEPHHSLLDILAARNPDPMVQ